ncbi:catalase family protein [Gloeocapsopsis crepidinum LEGE 06123]|uniref:Catalase family protein n=1 Tax=Gloeocapsopsis crepidinum LEGE 06123 TaxID=588587 RepID=A0ABR9US15_9CHRO|nr:catalase family protein [Gloeocapsopsis crepidinum]MBE9191049.1 catalase family protein [Gloeocapsopsis crepidinum LEGE 06123]
MQLKKEKIELGKEYPITGEIAGIKEIEQISIDALKQSFPDNIRPVLRDAHPKHHGCLRAEFIIHDDIPQELKVGIFKQPRTFNAGIRFSNNKVQDDTKKDVRGMAIKLFGIEGEKLLEQQKDEKTQDLLLINHPVFFIKDVQDYVEFFRARQAAKGNLPLKFFFLNPNPFKWHLREFIIGMVMLNKKVSSPLAIQYWSSTPYKLGDRAIKFTVVPNSNNATHSVAKSPDYLRQAMVEHLNSQEASFDFLIQLQTDAKKMPIEDPRIEWKSPFQKVATIKIPRQQFDSLQQMEFCEHLSFTPWHSLPEHQPLGGVNRARKQVYEALSELRHNLNNVVVKEPSEEEFLKLFGRMPSD